ncbi:hypothetical protein Hypma_000413 [Hypsizygus marmoreus]|uniref:Uncharacterized protein n=1 Tax=Hypsizygus marmoreus TaxID=39966 RepID=A0A369J903_HYPMA|nr:hypothetical protein Hypma_000413 [Hypsizygus marmoreus]
MIHIYLFNTYLYLDSYDDQHNTHDTCTPRRRRTTSPLGTAMTCNGDISRIKLYCLIMDMTAGYYRVVNSTPGTA